MVNLKQPWEQFWPIYTTVSLQAFHPWIGKWKVQKSFLDSTAEWKVWSKRWKKTFNIEFIQRSKKEDENTFMVSNFKNQTTSCHCGKTEIGNASNVSLERFQQRETKMSRSNHRWRNVKTRREAMNSCCRENILFHISHDPWRKREIETGILWKYRISFFSLERAWIGSCE